MEPMVLRSSTLAGGFFTPSASWVVLHTSFSIVRACKYHVILNWLELDFILLATEDLLGWIVLSKHSHRCKAPSGSESWPLRKVTADYLAQNFKVLAQEVGARLLLPSPLTTSSPSSWWLLWAPQGSERRKKEVKDKKSLTLLIQLCPGFGLSLSTRGTIAGFLSCGHFNGSLGDSLLNLLFFLFNFKL